MPDSDTATQGQEAERQDREAVKAVKAVKAVTGQRERDVLE